MPNTGWLITAWCATASLLPVIRVFERMKSALGPRIAICAIVRNEASYVEEWVNFHRNQGVSEFIIYDNESDDNTKEEFKKLGIDPANWGYRSKSFEVEQFSAYENARNWLKDKVDWVAYIDLDEFIFGRHGKSLVQALNDFDDTVSAIAVQQRLFGSSYLDMRLPGNVTDRFARCAAPDYLEHYWFKTISRPKRVERFDSVHSVVVDDGRYVLTDGTDLVRQTVNSIHPGHPGAADRIATGSIGLHHYIVKSREEFLSKSARWADRTQGKRKRIDNYWDNRQVEANTHVCGELVGSLDKYYSNILKRP